MVIRCSNGFTIDRKRGVIVHGDKFMAFRPSQRREYTPHRSVGFAIASRLILAGRVSHRDLFEFLYPVEFSAGPNQGLNALHVVMCQWARKFANGGFAIRRYRSSGETWYEFEARPDAEKKLQQQQTFAPWSAAVAAAGALTSKQFAVFCAINSAGSNGMHIKQLEEALYPGKTMSAGLLHTIKYSTNKRLREHGVRVVSDVYSRVWRLESI